MTEKAAFIITYSLATNIYSLLVGLLLSICVLDRTYVVGQSSNIVVIRNDKRLGTFNELLDKADISPSIGKTVFGPTGAAFESFRLDDPKRYDKWTTTPEFFVHVSILLEWHLVTQGIYTNDDIFDGQREFLENQQGQITVEQGSKMLDNIHSDDFLEADIKSSDGIIHIIDKVIVPPFLEYDMISQLLNSRQEKFSFSNMANLALHVGLDDRLNAAYEYGLTFLVPPNRRFNRAEIDIPKMLQPDMFNYTRDFILCHMIKDNYHDAKLYAMSEQSGEDQHLVMSELGTHMWITTTKNMVRFQSQELLLPDQPTNNGIFHGIDYPLFPPYITDFAFFTPTSTNVDTSDCYRFFAQCRLGSEDIAEMYNSNITAFCPTREAFSSFNYEDFNRLLSPDWYRHACEFLFNHMTLGYKTRAELVAESPRHITMLNGAVYNLRNSGDRPRIQNGNEEGRSNFGDLIALDGYLHTIDSVITPTAVSHSIYDMIQFNEDTSILKTNIDFVALTDYIATDSPLTILAPNNDAFRRVEFDTIDGGPIIKRHIITGLLFCDVLKNRTQVITVEGEVLGVEVKSDNSLWVGGARIYNCDVLAHNGVLHHVDRVIGIDFESPSPSRSPAPTMTPAPTKSPEPSSAPVGLFAENPDNGAVPIYLPPVQPPIHANQNQPTPVPEVVSGSAVTTVVSSLVLAVIGMQLLLSTFN